MVVCKNYFIRLGKNVKKNHVKKSIVIFDDYYDDTEIIKKYGCNKVINDIGDEFNYEILKFHGFFYIFQ